jgi:hypothetical protein
MSRVMRVTATNGVGREVYDATVSLDGVTDEQAPGEAIEFAIGQLRDQGMDHVQHHVAAWTVRQYWVGCQADTDGDRQPG